MPINQTSPPGKPSDLKVLGQGSFNSTGLAGAIEQIGNFTCPSLTAGDVLVIEMQSKKTANTITNTAIYIDNVTGALSGNQLQILNVASPSNHFFQTRITKSMEDPTNTGNVTTIVSSTTITVISNILTTGLFTPTAAFNVFLKEAITGSSTPVNAIYWIAYIIKTKVN